jgi:CHAD domain-containing protein
MTNGPKTRWLPPIDSLRWRSQRFVPFYSSGSIFMVLRTERTTRLFGKVTRLLGSIAANPQLKNIHQFRTTTRRVETILEMLVADADRNQRKLLKQLSKVRRRAGKMRDLDLQIAALRGLKASEQPRVKTRVVEALLELRAQQEEKLVQRLDGRTVSNLRRRLKKAQERFSDTLLDPQLVLSRMLSEFSNHSGPLNEEILHHYRIEGKKIRYIAELADESPYAQRVVAELKRMQDSLGEWHDWLTLNSTLTGLHPHIPHSPLLAAVNNIRKAKYRDAVQEVLNAKAALPAGTECGRPEAHSQAPSATQLPALRAAA